MNTIKHALFNYLTHTESVNLVFELAKNGKGGENTVDCLSYWIIRISKLRLKNNHSKSVVVNSMLHTGSCKQHNHH